jgi:hypothetical protein
MEAYDITSENGKKYTEKKGQRVYTITIPLNNDTTTKFNRINETIVSTTGSMLIYDNILHNSKSSRDKDMEHTLYNTNESETYLLNIYVREKDAENNLPMELITDTVSIDNATIDTAVLAMDDAEVPQENRVIFMSNSTYTLLKNASKITRQFDIDTNGQKVINREFEYFDDMMVIKVPKARFFNEITLHDGSVAFGFEKTAATGKDINFMIVHKPAVVAITRHVKVRIFDSNTNQDADADKYQYRIYHDLIVLMILLF